MDKMDQSKTNLPCVHSMQLDFEQVRMLVTLNRMVMRLSALTQILCVRRSTPLMRTSHLMVIDWLGAYGREKVDLPAIGVANKCTV